MFRSRKATCEQVGRRTAEHRGGDDGAQLVLDVADGLLQTEGEENDAGDHREVEVRVGVAAALVALPVGRKPREIRSATSATTSK